MRTARPTKTDPQARRRGGPRKRIGDPSGAPLGGGPNRSAARPISEAGERQGRARFSDLTLMAFLAVAAALPYLNTLRNGFASDDEVQVLQNPYIRSFHYLAKIFTTSVTGYFPGGPNYYRPFMNLGYLICYQISGYHPFSYHLVNLVLNVLVVGAVFLFTMRMFQDRDLALISTVLFAFHPIHSEVVAWVAASTDLELSLFYLLTFWFFLAEERPGSRSSYRAQLAMGGSFALALISKEQGVTLPVLATLYEHLYRADRKETSPAEKVRRYAMLWLLAGVYLLFRARILGRVGSGFHTFHLTWYQTFLSAAALLGKYFWKLLCPLDLRVMCPFHSPSSLFDPAVVEGLAAMALCGALFFYLWRRARLLSFGLLWMLVLLAPVLNVRWMSIFAFSERYLYLPSVGFCWLLGRGLLGLRDRASARGAIWNRALAGGFGVLMALCGLRIVTRNRDWRDTFTLYPNTLAACPEAFYIRRFLGMSYFRIGDLVSAGREWQKVLKAEPQDPWTLSYLGMVYLKEQRESEALEFFKRALASNPDDGDSRLYLGVIYMDRHWFALAEPELWKAVSLNPLNSNARNALGKLYLAEGRAAEAEDQFHRSVESEPNLVGYANLGLIHWQRGEAKLAEEEWREGLRLAPNDPSMLNTLGRMCIQQGRYTEAVSFFHRATEQKPGDPSYHSNLGMGYEKTGQTESAEGEFRTALSLDPANSQAHFQLGALYLSQGRKAEALSEYQAGLKSDPQNRDALEAVRGLSFPEGAR